MKKEKQSDPQMQKLADLIGEASIAMLTTEDADGSLRSRPLATLQMDSAGKLWTPWVEPWFPDGGNDPDLGLLEVTVDDAEYWDAPSSKTQRLFGLAKALSTGQTDRLGEHGTVHRAQ